MSLEEGAGEEGRRCAGRRHGAVPKLPRPSLASSAFKVQPLERGSKPTTLPLLRSATTSETDAAAPTMPPLLRRRRKRGGFEPAEGDAADPDAADPDAALKGEQAGPEEKLGQKANGRMPWMLPNRETTTRSRRPRRVWIRSLRQHDARGTCGRAASNQGSTGSEHK